jgi:hypothetical protein
MYTLLKRLLSLAPILTALGASGCGLQQQALQSTTGYGVAAEQLDPTLVEAALKNTAQDNVAVVARLIDDSQKKCSDFLNRLVLAETGTDTSLDIFTTVFAALATAFTPLATVHGLTAAAAISSGSKTAIDSDIYAKASIAHFAQAIQSTYYQDMGNEVLYIGALANDPTLINPAIELNRIRPIHKECALASAEAAISASLQPSAQAAGPSTSALTVTVNGAAKKNDNFELDGSYTPTGSTTPITLTAKHQVTAANGESAPNIAGILAAIINSNSQSNFRGAGVTATPQAGQPSFILNTPAGIKWTSPFSNLSVSQAAVPPAAVSAPAPGATPPPPAPPIPLHVPAPAAVAQPKPVVPGHGVNQ